MAIPEQDDWEYAAFGGRPVFTPASFVVNALREYGIFHGAEINASEFTVTDVYQLDIYDKFQNLPIPERCVEADWGQLYC